MISKKRAFIYAAIIVILTSIFNFTLGNIFAIPLGQKVIINRHMIITNQWKKNSKIIHAKGF